MSVIVEQMKKTEGLNYIPGPRGRVQYVLVSAQDRNFKGSDASADGGRLVSRSCVWIRLWGSLRTLERPPGGALLNRV